MFELVISSENDASSGVYDTEPQAIAAVDQAAAVDGLTARYDRRHAGALVDDDGATWFAFEIKEP